MELLERRDLGEAGRAYIHERLASGKTLSTLLRHLDLAGGETWTELPVWATGKQTYQFSECAWSVTGSYLTHDLQARPDLPDSFDAAMRRVLRLLRGQERAMAIWEDAQVKASDPGVKDHSAEPLAFVGDDVYYLLTGQTATDANVAHGLTTMVAWWGSPAVVATPPADVAATLRPSAELTRDHLQAVVDHVRLVFFQAYDCLGYVFWTPSTQATAG